MLAVLPTESLPWSSSDFFANSFLTYPSIFQKFPVTINMIRRKTEKLLRISVQTLNPKYEFRWAPRRGPIILPSPKAELYKLEAVLI